MEGLGRNFNAIPSVTTANARVYVGNTSQVSLVVVGTGNVTLQQHLAQSGGTPADLDVDHFYTLDTGLWTRTDQAAGNVVAAADDLTVIEIDTKALDDGVQYISASIAAGTILHVHNDLVVQRNPESLASPLV